jgi:NAD+ kinase
LVVGYSDTLIVYNARSHPATELAESLAVRLGTDYPILSADAAGPGVSTEGVRTVVTVGGDGTILRAIALAAPAGLPILGVNSGRLGFMTEVEAAQSLDEVPRYLEPGYAWVETRSMLEARVDSRMAADAPWGPVHVLNDVVVGRGVPTRLVRIRVVVDSVELATYSADALIVATATGSTGYALSAGGSILHPGSPDMLIVPVAPHVSFSSSVVVPGGSSVRMTLLTDHDAALSADGYQDLPLHQGDTVHVSTSSQVGKFLRAGDRGEFYSRIASRLRLGQDQERLRSQEELEPSV